MTFHQTTYLRPTKFDESEAWILALPRVRRQNGTWHALKQPSIPVLDLQRSAANLASSTTTEYEALEKRSKTNSASPSQTRGSVFMLAFAGRLI
jgi:hypothetical protein